ncbi:hypothetical protein F5882DRAFT_402883 [Hyaloscypha sp. PMI_1271]|nr:hypothetical protein F5882DRAFT_402883 [Hyaloscypha sp. PMI_1271]
MHKFMSLGREWRCSRYILDDVKEAEEESERSKKRRQIAYQYAGSCELIIQRSPSRRMEDPSQKPHLPFDGDTSMALVRALDLNLQWLSDRGNDSGTIRVGFCKGNGRRYVFQSPFYKKGSWTLAMTVQYPGSSIREVIGWLTESLKIVGILEVDHSLDLSTLLDEVHLSALGFCHPLLLPVTLLEHHVQESARHFMAISHKLSSVEDAIDPSAAERSLLATTPTPGNSSRQSYGILSKEVYECNKSLFELERRRDYEKRLQDFLTNDLNEYRDENGVKLENRLNNVKAVSNNRDLDMKSLPLRIEALQNLIRNLVAQQDSQATIQIARSTMQENAQMTALTKATLKDSNAMKNIAVLTTIFLPGTYMASLFSTTMFNFSDSTGLQISSHFWIYWVITIPLTIIAFGGLQALIKYREMNEETDVGVKEKEKGIDEEKGIHGNRVGSA